MATYYASKPRQSCKNSEFPIRRFWALPQRILDYPTVDSVHQIRKPGIALQSIPDFDGIPDLEVSISSILECRLAQIGLIALTNKDV